MYHIPSPIFTFKIVEGQREIGLLNCQRNKENTYIYIYISKGYIFQKDGR